jgi:hypothetical protein
MAARTDHEKRGDHGNGEGIVSQYDADFAGLQADQI